LSTELKDRYVTLGAEPGRGSLAELDAFVAAEVRRFGEVAKAANMHVE
jgi:tripartite-type tricarboxylate transporter receptor subunit TctC